MKKMQLLTLLVTVSMLTINCGSSQKAKPDYVDAKKISYKTDVEPIIANSCTPCHIPPQGRKEPLENYAHVKENIGEILERVQLPQDNHKAMPPANKKPPLTTEQIAVLVKWKQQNMAE
jgi:uncharacterized membrane protein